VRNGTRERYLSVDIMPVPVPMSTLSDEYHDEPTEPEDDHEPEPEPPGLIRRVIEGVSRRSDAGH
jgi:hypothetical protein